jgi:DNA-binding transcriptional ArsR family regulator
MATAFQIAELASQVGQPPRAAMLEALMDGRALTATELASVAGIMPQTASTHLARLTAAGLVCVTRQGRHRYHRVGDTHVPACWKTSCEWRPRAGPRFVVSSRGRATPR